MFDIRNRDIKYLTGVGPHRAELFNKELNIHSVHDLIYYFPYKYIDRSRIFYIHEIDGDMPYIQLRGYFVGFETLGEGRNKRFVGYFRDKTGQVELVWFNGIKYVQSRYKVNTEYIVFGKPTVYGNRINIAHPDIESVDEWISASNGLKPYYNTTERMKKNSLNSVAISKIMANAIKMIDYTLPETLPNYLISQESLMSLDQSIRTIHFPTNNNELRKAQYRLKFEELFYIQLSILRYVNNRQKKYRGYVFSKIGSTFNDFYNNCLPFQLTNAQKRVIKEIRTDLGSGRQMNRLLQGDVGSGKTLVALMTMLIGIDNNYQACMMAPTEILAYQHYETILKLVEGLNVRVEILTGSVKGKKRENILEGLASGEVNIIIGTHAIIEENVAFRNLAIAIIDEQHRFGVEQRAKLWNKNEKPPHILVMTATPIPRTLAMTLYGDLDVSVIDELPPGRKPISTIHIYDRNRDGLNDSIRKQIEAGRQVYIVYPLIKENEKLDLKNIEDGYENIKKAFPNYNVCKVHGKMRPSEKDKEMQRFASGEAHIMVATTVIEVGVNVPNASVMVIENAERFGLSQLHQLRGRVGRGAEQSYCILVTDYKISQDTRKRLEIMTSTNDGFEIAEADLKLRGPGDLEGTQQSGVAFDLKIANITRDAQLLQHVRNIAEEIIDNDSNEEKTENNILWRQLDEMKRGSKIWSDIS